MRFNEYTISVSLLKLKISQFKISVTSLVWEPKFRVKCDVIIRFWSLKDNDSTKKNWLFFIVDVSFSQQTIIKRYNNVNLTGINTAKNYLLRKPTFLYRWWPAPSAIQDTIDTTWHSSRKSSVRDATICPRSISRLACAPTASLVCDVPCLRVQKTGCWPVGWAQCPEIRNCRWS